MKELGMDPTIHDIRLSEQLENPTLGTWGLGAWEVWLNGMEVTPSSPTSGRSAASSVSR